MSDKEPQHGQESSYKNSRKLGKHIWCAYCEEWVPAKDWKLHEKGIICKIR